MSLTNPRIVVMGGGTGTFTVLSGIRKHPVMISAIVSSADNGGSTGILRDELGVLPPGDIRQCLVALAEENNTLWRRFFSHRVEKEGTLKGHTGGNLVLSLLEDMTGDPLEAIDEAHKLLKVQGRVIPVSTKPTHLMAELEDGTRVEGEHALDELKRGESRAPIKSCSLEPMVQANPEAEQAILAADLVVMGPGDLYTSLQPVLLVEGIREALAQTSAKIVYVVNLMSKRGQTDGFSARTFIEKVHGMIAPAKLSAVVVNRAVIPEAVVQLYADDGEHPIESAGLEEVQGMPRLIHADLLSEAIRVSSSGDALRRSVLRHDPHKLARAILFCLG